MLKGKCVIKIKNKLFDLTLNWDGTLVMIQAFLLLLSLFFILVVKSAMLTSLGWLFLLCYLGGGGFFIYRNSEVNVEAATGDSKRGKTTKKASAPKEEGFAPADVPKNKAPKSEPSNKPAKEPVINNKVPMPTATASPHTPTASDPTGVHPAVQDMEEISDEDWEKLFNIED